MSYRSLRATLLASVFAWATPGVQAAELGITPAAVNLSDGNDRTLVHVVNQGSDTVVLHAEAIAWQRDGGVDKDAPTADLAVNPPVFTLAPGATQVVRLSLLRTAEADRERAYRVVLREVLPAAGGAPARPTRAHARTTIETRVPVYVAPAAVRREQRWQARIEGGQLVAQVVNTGNVHYKVGALRVSGDTHPVAQGLLAVLFPGEVRSFRLRAPTVLADKVLALEVRTEFGVQRVTLELASH